MANISYLWQLVGSLKDSINKFEEVTKSGNQSDANRLKTLIFEIHERIDEEVKNA